MDAGPAHAAQVSGSPAGLLLETSCSCSEPGEWVFADKTDKRSTRKSPNRLDAMQGMVGLPSPLSAAVAQAVSLIGVIKRRPDPRERTPEDIAALMAATATIHSPFRAATHRTLIGLLAVTGMRIGEAIALDQADVDLAAGVVTVRAGKFGAARELPLHDTTLRALDEYRQVRDGRGPKPEVPAFFVSMRGTRLLSGHVREAFRDLRRRAGLTAVPGGRAPRVHDLRHSFAVATLVDWYRADADVAALLPGCRATSGTPPLKPPTDMGKGWSGGIGDLRCWVVCAGLRGRQAWRVRDARSD
jgi:integrase